MSFFDDPALDNPFWQFSLDRYSRPSVATACLDLQDRTGIDVNLLLFAFWLGHERGRITKSLVALDAVVDWHETVVKPLRRARIARRPLPGNPEDPVRQAIKELEVQTEQIEQAILFRMARDLATEAGVNTHADMIQNAQRLMPVLAMEGDALNRLAALCL